MMRFRILYLCGLLVEGFDEVAGVSTVFAGRPLRYCVLGRCISLDLCCGSLTRQTVWAYYG